MSPNRRLFLKQLSLSSAALGLLPFISGCQSIEVSSNRGGLPRSSPEAQGISSQSILDFLDAIDANNKHEFHSLMVSRHGNVIAEGWWTPYAPTLNHTMYSMSKS